MAFDFLSGQNSAPQYGQKAMQAYSPAWNTGQPQGMDYSQVLGGGSAMPATQGLDFSKIGQWATSMAQQQQSPDWQKAASALGPTQATQGSQPTASPLQAAHIARQLGNIQQGAAGYIGNGTRSGLLGVMR